MFWSSFQKYLECHFSANKQNIKRILIPKATKQNLRCRKRISHIHMNTNTHAHAHTHIIKLYALNLKGVYFLSSYRFLKCCINIYLYFWFKTLYQIIFDYHSQFPTKPYFIIFIFFLKYIRKKLCQLEAIMNEIMCLRSNAISRVVFSVDLEKHYCSLFPFK